MSSDITCPKCAKSNTTEARFCIGCGTPLTSIPMATSQGPDPMIGKLISDRFLILDKVGEGGMGRVYRAEQTSIQRLVALKVLNPALTQQHNVPERFRNEASLASRLNHPNTVVIYDFGVTEDGSMFIAMELIKGRSLDSELSEHGAIGWRQTCRIAIQICSSLQNAHDNNIIHRDLKPENIMLTQSGADSNVVKVLDFGIAKILSEDVRGIQSGLTAPNEIFGTPEYMSPEQVRSAELDNRTDIYSLGIILYRMLTGKLPFSAKTPIETVTKHLVDTPKPFNEINPNIELPPELEILVLSTLSKDPAERPRTMSLVFDRLRGLLESGTRRVAHPEVAHPETSHTKPSDSKPVAISQPASPLAKTVAVQIGDTAEDKVEEPVDIAEDVEEPVDIAEDVEELVGVAEDVEEPVDIAEDVEELVGAAEDISFEDDEGSTLDKLIVRMKQKRDFPAISQHLNELNTKVALETTSAPKLANVILKDTALTTKLIKLVNSPFYGQVRGRITMVSRAVVLMGFEAVREAALSLLLFDHLQGDNPEQAQELQEAALGSLMSGIVARTMAEDIDGMNKEEAFVCAMFHNLGRHVAIYYFPEEMEEVNQLVKHKGLTERAAAYRVLGVSLEELGKELGKQWDFPDGIRNTMTRLPPGNMSKPLTKDDRLRHLAGFSNELTEIIATSDPAEKAAKFKTLSRRFERSIKVSDEQIEELLDTTADQLEEHAKIMNLRLNESPLVLNVMRSVGRNVSMPPGEELPDEQTATASARIEQNPKALKAGRERSAQKNIAKEVALKKQILANGVEEVAAALGGKYDLNGVMLMVIETMYRGLGFSHVIFCLNDVQKRVMRARSGFGDGVEEMIKRFQFSLRGRSDVFSQTANQGRDLVVHDTRSPRFASKIPKWYKETANAPMFLLYPITLKRFPAAMFYGDLTQPNVQLDKGLLDQMNKLRDHAAQAIKKSYQFKKY
ncbi:MAG: HDOD domain-containing protein [Proteobacteria bacterium]|nr:HDOD domain-containing protein [Pseudomonadota bacterium]